MSDFPAGWSTSKDNSSSADDKKFQAQMARCMHAPPGLIGGGDKDAANVDSPDYDSPDQSETVSETVSIAPGSKVTQLFGVLSGPSATDCIASTLNASLRTVLAKSSDPQVRGAKVGNATVGNVSFPRIGDDTIAMRATVPVSANGFSLSVYADLVFVRLANAAAILSFENEGSAFDVTTMERYARLAFRRLRAVDIPSA